MRRVVSVELWACCLGLLLAAVSAQFVEKIYKKIGDDVVLKAGDMPNTINSIVWKEGPNLAIEWDGQEVDSYRQFKVRGSLNNATGEMTIRGLTPEDSAVYSVEINGGQAAVFDLIVISAVPEPTVTESCDEKKTSCILTCEGNTTGAGSVVYKWKLDDTVIETLEKMQKITKDDSSNIRLLSCELKNPVSQRSSEPIHNPLFNKPPPPTTTTTAPGDGPSLNIKNGVTVFVCLLVFLLLLAVIHRCKAGMCFYEKDSFPWERDFWRKNEKNKKTSKAKDTKTDPEKKLIEAETPV